MRQFTRDRYSNALCDLHVLHYIATCDMLPLKVRCFVTVSGEPSALVIFLYLAGLWCTKANINGPCFHPKFTLAAQTIGYRRSAASHVDWPSRTLLTVRPARQDAVLQRRMTTTALCEPIHQDYRVVFSV